MNWNTYSDIFPSRYIREGKIDDLITEYLRGESMDVLEIGGGTGSCVPLQKNRNHTVWLLDPHIKKYPKWIKDKVDWETLDCQFDLVVARSCINYLTREEISKIPGFIREGGKFIANTFRHPPIKPVSRKDVNRIGEEIVERSEMISFDLIQHTLIRPGQPPIIHTFFYYRPDEYASLLGDCKFIEYGKNSIIIIKGG